MFLEQLHLTDFRTYVQLDLSFAPGMIVFQGRNAQGKSNLLETISLLATSRSFRTRSEREAVRWGSAAGFTRIKGRVIRSSGLCLVEIVLTQLPEEVSKQTEVARGLPLISTLQGGKRIKVNGIPRRPLDLLGQVLVVVFVPSDLELVTGSPAQRRRYLNVILCQVSRRYSQTLVQLQQVLLQRGALLRRIRLRAESPDALPYWDQHLATLSGSLMWERARLVEQLDAEAQNIYGSLFNGNEMMHVVYRPSVSAAVNASSSEALAAIFREQLMALRQREIHMGVNLLGPQRDDVQFLGERQRDLALFGSRGQQRSVALAMKLAEVDYVHTITGEEPLLLLDDVFSELDEERSSALYSRIQTIEQVFITMTSAEAGPAPLLQTARRYLVQDGTVVCAQG